MPRDTADGRQVFAGHVGTIYQAANAVYLGQTERRTVKLLPDGRVFNARALSKVRGGERGWEGACRQLEAAGAPPAPGELEARRSWLRTWTRRLTRNARGAKHRYAFQLSRGPFPLGPYLKGPKKA